MNDQFDTHVVDSIIDEIINLSNKGISKREILSSLSKKYNIPKDRLDEFYNSVLNIPFDDTEILRNLNSERILNLYQLAMSNGEHKLALRCLDLLNKTNNLYATKLQIDGDTDLVFEIN